MRGGGGYDQRRPARDTIARLQVGGVAIKVVDAAVDQCRYAYMVTVMGGIIRNNPDLAAFGGRSHLATFESFKFITSHAFTTANGAHRHQRSRCSNLNSLNMDSRFRRNDVEDAGMTGIRWPGPSE